MLLANAVPAELDTPQRYLVPWMQFGVVEDVRVEQSAIKQAERKEDDGR
jgi:hypothetical protein